MYQEALQAKGYTVTLKANIGSSELTDKALTSGQIQMYPEYTGVILSVIKGQSKVPVSAAAAEGKHAGHGGSGPMRSGSTTRDSPVREPGAGTLTEEEAT